MQVVKDARNSQLRKDEAIHHRKMNLHASFLCEHISIHSRFRPYVCAVCGKAFITASLLQRHNRTHTGECPFQCDSCNKAFKNFSYLKMHKTTHTTERSYKCDTCNKTFKSAHNLLIQQRVMHTGERPFRSGEHTSELQSPYD